MKALSIRQPWAYAIMHLGKDVENRDWPTNFRGRVAVHASGNWVKPDYEIDAAAVREICGVTIPPREEFTLGAIVGTVEILGCVTSSKSPWFFGKYGFLLVEPKPLPTPIPIKGLLGFWEVPADVEQQILEVPHA